MADTTTTNNDQKHNITDNVVDDELASTGCGILGKFPVLSVLLFAAVGIGAGIGLSYWEPENMENKDVLLKWLGLIGDLFVSKIVNIVVSIVMVS